MLSIKLESHITERSLMLVKEIYRGLVAGTIALLTRLRV
jgi:hypothetical protein